MNPWNVSPFTPDRAALARFNHGTTKARNAYAERTNELDPPPVTDACAGCRATHVLQSRGLCSPCYQRNRRAGTLSRYPRRDRP